MPLHDFKCEKCGERTEELIRNQQDLIEASNCPKCGAARVKCIGVSYYHMSTERYLERVRGVNALAPAPIRESKNQQHIGHSQFGTGMRGHYEKNKG